MICIDCNRESDKIRDGICFSCRVRKGHLKDKYIPFKDLSEEEQYKVLRGRKSEKEKIKNSYNKENSFPELKEEIIQNLTEAYSKLNISMDSVEPDIKGKLNQLIEIIDYLQSYNKDQLEVDRLATTKKIDIIDKYIIDLLHNVERKQIDDNEGLLYEAKKENILRKIRRDYKNEEKCLSFIKKFFNGITKDNVKLNDIKKEAISFMNSMDSQFYNPYVENPNNDDKVLGLHKFRIQCKIASNNTDRKVLQFNEIIKGKNQDDAKKEAIKVLREKYGESVVWSSMYISFLR